MAHSKLAFLSYSSRYADWAGTLHGNLERELGSGTVWLDRVDIGPGKSWVTKIQLGLVSSEYVVLVVTPEAMASPRVIDELETEIAGDRHWRGGGKLVPVWLVETFVPPFLETIQRIDFTNPSRDAYLRGLAELVSALRGAEDKRGVHALAQKLSAHAVIPKPPDQDLPWPLRSEILLRIAKLLDRKTSRIALNTKLGLPAETLDGYATQELCANAALVESRGADTAPAAAERLLRVVLNLFGEDDESLASDVGALIAKLPQASAGSNTLIARYLEHVATEHELQLPYFRQSAPSQKLDPVYVELALAARESIEVGRAASDGAARAPRVLIDFLNLSSAEHPWVTRRWVVRGDPGAGKTTLLRHVAYQLATSPRLAAGRVPVYASLPRLLQEREPLLDREQRIMNLSMPADGLRSALESEAESGNLVLLLDGLDEVPGGQPRADALQLLRNLSRQWKAATIVVSSRPIGYESPDGEFVELDLQPLEREQRKEFLARWFASGDVRDEARAEAILETLSADTSLWDLSKTPLYLALIAILVSRDKSPARRRSALFEQIFALLLNGEHKEQPVRMPNQHAVRAALRRIAWLWTLEDCGGESRDALESRLYRPEQDDVTRELQRHPPWRDRLSAFLDDVGRQTGILGPHGGKDADWRFWHKSFREMLAAEVLEHEHKTGGLDACRVHMGEIAGNEGRWAEPFALLAGRVKDAGALIEELMKVSDSLGLRALATADDVSPEAMRKLLGLSSDAIARSRVLSELPKRVADPERAIRLLDEIRKTTRNGQDLHFIDAALAEIEAKDPEHRARVERARRDLFAHVPKPPRELFEKVRTRDGEVSLWAPIPAGTHTLGERDEQVEFENRSPFWLSVVPITRAMYSAFDPDFGRDDRGADHEPVVHLTWHEAAMFARWLGGRLPTEWEWEYACRAMTTTDYWSGNAVPDLARVGWYHENSGRRLHSVGEKPANPWGLYDVHGNAWEWCADEIGDGFLRMCVVRGGRFRSNAGRCRSTTRDWFAPGYRKRDIGFRVALSAPGVEWPVHRAP